MTHTINRLFMDEAAKPFPFHRNCAKFNRPGLLSRTVGNCHDMRTM
jgi:hypothetical protein